MKIAIVGCGMIADAHVNIIKQIPNSDLVAVCDTELMMAEQLSDRYNIPNYYQSLNELLNKCHPDVVHILTPPTTHLALATTAIEAGCDVLLEKPFTLTSEEAQALIKTAIENNRKIIVNHFHNFSPPSILLKKMISHGLIGDILHMEGFYSYSTRSPVATTLINNENSWLHKLPGKLFQNNIDHLIAKFVEFFPDEQPEVFAFAKQLSPEVKNSPSHIEDELRVMIMGETVSGYATFSSNIAPFQHFMKVYGTKGSIIVDYESRTLVSMPDSRLPGPFGKLFKPFSIGTRYYKEGVKNIIKFGKSDYHYYAGASNLFKNFYKTINDGLQPLIPYKNILKVTYLMDNIFMQINRRSS